MANKSPKRKRSHKKVGVEVREGLVGRGVYATRSFRAGQLIGRVTGELRYEEDYTSSYCMDFSEEASLEPDPPFRFINHACEPNSELVVIVGESDADSEMTVYATRKIKAGDELTIDYSWPVDSAIPCLCGSANCRGWVVNEEDLDELPDRRPPTTSPEAA